MVMKICVLGAVYVLCSYSLISWRCDSESMRIPTHNKDRNVSKTMYIVESSTRMMLWVSFIRAEGVHVYGGARWYVYDRRSDAGVSALLMKIELVHLHQFLRQGV